MDERRIDVTLEVFRRPWRLRQFINRGNVFEHARAMSKQRNSIRILRFVEIKFNVNVAKCSANVGQLMQPPSFVLPRLDGVLLPSNLVDHRNARAGMPNAIAQLRREIPLDLFSRERANSIEQ